jgi:hypothetical protein
MVAPQPKPEESYMATLAEFMRSKRTQQQVTPADVARARRESLGIAPSNDEEAPDEDAAILAQLAAGVVCIALGLFCLAMAFSRSMH